MKYSHLNFQLFINFSFFPKNIFNRKREGLNHIILNKKVYFSTNPHVSYVGEIIGHYKREK